MGFMVGPAELIREARALRRLMIRHPAANNQRTVAMFLADGHHDALLRRLCNVYRERLAAAITALVKHLPEFTVNLTAGGTALWISGPKQLDMNAVGKEALKRGVVIEPGAVHFMAQPGPANYLPPGRFLHPDRTDRARHQAAGRNGARAVEAGLRRSLAPPLLSPRTDAGSAAPPRGRLMRYDHRRFLWPCLRRGMTRITPLRGLSGVTA